MKFSKAYGVLVIVCLLVAVFLESHQPRKIILKDHATSAEELEFIQVAFNLEEIAYFRQMAVRVMSKRIDISLDNSSDSDDPAVAAATQLMEYWHQEVLAAATQDENEVIRKMAREVTNQRKSHFVIDREEYRTDN
ncbi:MAG: hypothetical protein CMI53_00355 [Parcubacteria group bacterium]|nr:hypothetical protein [Parcubacteria group bacterium]|tara:strand:+ start:3441 stop:3848 length:408 start_codon:yes stop_codon:yes gene_type:complete